MNTTAKNLYDAKCKAIEYFNVPKSKTNLVAIEPGYLNDFDETCVGWIAFYKKENVEITRET